MPSRTLESPIGPLRVTANEKGVTAIHFASHGRAGAARRAADRKQGAEIEPEDASPSARAAARRHLDAAVRQLEEYFAGTREGFDLDLFMTGTDFEARVWKRLARIPHGETCTYAEIARAAGAPGGARAAGAAIGKNPVPIFRAIGSSAPMDRSRASAEAWSASAGSWRTNRVRSD